MAEPAGEVTTGPEAVDQVAVAEEVDLLDARDAVGDPGAGQQGVDRSPAGVDGGVDRRRVGEVDLDRLHPLEGDRGPVHHDDLGAGVEGQLGGGGAHAGGPTDDEDPLAVVSERVEQAHGRNLSGSGVM